MELTWEAVVHRDALSSHDRTEWVEVTLDPEVLLFSSFAGGGHIGHHNLLLLPGSQEEVINLGLLRGGLVKVANFLHSEVDLECPPLQDMHPRHDFVGIRI